MKIAVISDIHDNAHNLVMALNQIKSYNVNEIVFLWDFCGAAIAWMLAKSPVKVRAIWWNNDWDKSLITKFSLAEWSNLDIWFDVFDTIEIDDRKIFLSHYPLLATPIAKSGDFDAVFYGHNHLKYKERIWNCLVLNPGEIWAYKTWIATFAIYDTKTNDAEIIEVNDSITSNTKESQDKFKEIGYIFNQQKGHQY